MSAPTVPRVSIAVPVYERTEGLARALTSALNQEVNDGAVEILLVDDASTADVAAFLRTVGSRSRVRFVRNQRNLGLCGNWNRCMELASAPIVNVLHSDELLSPGALRRVLEAFHRNPGLGMVCSGRGTPDVIHSAGRPAVLETMKGVQPVSSVFLRKSVLSKSGVFDPRYPYFPDLELFPRIASAHDVMFLDSPPLASAPQHSRHHMFSTWEREDFLEAFTEVRRIGFGYAGESPAEANRRALEDADYSCRHIMWTCWRGGMDALARRYFRHAVRGGRLPIQRAERFLNVASRVPLGTRIGLACLSLRWKAMTLGRSRTFPA